MRKVLLIFFLLNLFICSKCLAEQLVVISPHWEGMRYEFENGFNTWRKSKGLTEATISWRDIGGTSEIVRFVQSEFQGNAQSLDQKDAGIGIDLVFGGGTDPFETFKKLNLLTKLDISPEILNQVASEVAGIPLYDSEHYWFAPTMAAFGIFCNQKVLSILGLQVPQSWEDILKPEFASWLTSADPRRSGSSHMFYEIILQVYGWEKGWQVIFGLAKNYRAFLASSPQVILDVVNGEVACGFAIDSQANAQINLYPYGQFVFSVPKNHSLFNGDGIAVLKGAPNFEAAQSFVEFSLSEQGQRLLYMPKGSSGGPIQYDLHRLPVLPKLFENNELRNLNPFQKNIEHVFKFDSSTSSRRWEGINDLLGIFVIEAKDARRISKPECQSVLPNEQDFNVLLEQKIWDSPIERNKIISAWRNSAAKCDEPSSLNYRALPFLIVFILGLFSICHFKIKRKK